MEHWSAVLEGQSPVAFRIGQGTSQPLPGWAASTPAMFECTTVSAGANRSVQICYNLSRSSAVAMQSGLGKQPAQVRTRLQAMGGGHCKRALLLATHPPLSSGGGCPYPPSRLLSRQQRERKGCATVQNRMDRVFLGCYPHTCMALDLSFCGHAGVNLEKNVAIST